MIVSYGVGNGNSFRVISAILMIGERIRWDVCSDLGSDFHAKRVDPERRKRAHIHQLETLGYKVTI